jgi:chromate transporter
MLRSTDSGQEEGASLKPLPLGGPVKADVSVLQIFLEFLLIGSTSFGGGVVAYLRSSLVAKRRWLNDKEFVKLLSISQTLPGLNATNTAILLGDRLRGFAGAIAAICGVCLPAGLLMYAVAIAYHVRGDRPLIVAMLKGVAPAAVGLILVTAVELSRMCTPSFD